MKLQELNKFKLPKNFRGRSGFIVQTWWIIQSIFFKNSPQFMYSWRKFLLTLFGAKIGRNVLIRPSVHIQFPWKLEIGDDSWIGDEVVLYNLGNIIIGSNVVISQRSYICTGTHDYAKSDFPIIAYTNIIENEVWIATDVYVAPGVKIGKGAVVGARSSVFKNVRENTINFGSPVKEVSSRYIK
ncbi:WcaF family extracellular polysaccharide biosynthesis acetyltransferase [Flectobacillus sp. BAB-3569]|uniref:WcaF family extracellular polysaccharide biosynthesis acetyltransferase n=1 Tax=Flectobacillus sp. BAB-3569 TaxID=1509483 RepID=UPI000BA4D183|nr:WcaF family extracellular polysaccharide biosynthesis acetyltransferase [Flectobacillus sp. BAB-3569]PAC30625.1 colanic acid biosynthesis acetyltransferase WcaF [Flectobacillus sp. BAB-3569]